MTHPCTCSCMPCGATEVAAHQHSVAAGLLLLLLLLLLGWAVCRWWSTCSRSCHNQCGSTCVRSQAQPSCACSPRSWRQAAAWPTYRCDSQEGLRCHTAAADDQGTTCHQDPVLLHAVCKRIGARTPALEAPLLPRDSVSTLSESWLSNCAGPAHRASAQLHALPRPSSSSAGQQSCRGQQLTTAGRRDARQQQRGGEAAGWQLLQQGACGRQLHH